jgi:hypothetical protein
MTPEAIGAAAAMVLSHKKPVTLYVRHAENHSGYEATDRIPCPQSFAVDAGVFTRSIPLDALAEALSEAQRELSVKRRPR